MRPIQDWYYELFNNKKADLKIKHKIGGFCQGENLEILPKFYHKGYKIYNKYDYVKNGEYNFRLTPVGNELKYEEIEVTDFFKKDLKDINKFISSDIGVEEKLGKLIFKKYKFKEENKLPDLKNCEKEEYNTYIFQKYLEKREIKGNELIYKFIDLENTSKEYVLKKIEEYELNKSKKELKTETKQSVILPEKSLEISQIGIFESIIFIGLIFSKIFLK